MQGLGQRDRCYTDVLKTDYPNVREYAYSTTTTALANIGYRINTNNVIKYSSLFINNSTDAVGYYGINGLGRNRDAILNTDEGFYVMNVQFNQDMIFVISNSPVERKFIIKIVNSC